MRRLLTSFIALAAMLMTSVEVKAWDAVAFRSTIDGIWDANATSGKMKKVDDNHFYIDITTNGDVSFRFYVSNGEQWQPSCVSSSVVPMRLAPVVHSLYRGQMLPRRVSISVGFSG